MLEELKSIPHRGSVHRLAGPRSVQALAEELGLVGADSADFESAVGQENLARVLLDDPFEPKIFQDMPPYGGPTRFSDGTFAVFYGAKTRETCEEEMGHYRTLDGLKVPPDRRPKFMWAFRCEFDGIVIDLCAKQWEWDWLTSNVTCDPNCLALGREAVAAGSPDAFHAPSARHSGGTSVPTFQPDVLSNPVIEGTTVFSFDAAADRAVWQRSA